MWTPAGNWALRWAPASRWTTGEPRPRAAHRAPRHAGVARRRPRALRRAEPRPGGDAPLPLDLRARAQRRDDRPDRGGVRAAGLRALGRRGARRRAVRRLRRAVATAVRGA